MLSTEFIEKAYFLILPGGPLVKVEATPEHGPRYFLFGLVSVGVPSCGKFPLPAVYTNISYYLPWIMSNIE